MIQNHAGLLPAAVMAEKPPRRGSRCPSLSHGSADAGSSPEAPLTSNLSPPLGLLAQAWPQSAGDSRCGARCCVHGKPWGTPCPTGVPHVPWGTPTAPELGKNWGQAGDGRWHGCPRWLRSWGDTWAALRGCWGIVGKAAWRRGQSPPLPRAGCGVLGAARPLGTPRGLRFGGSPHPALSLLGVGVRPSCVSLDGEDEAFLRGDGMVLGAR